MHGTVVDARERKANKMQAVPVTVGGGRCTIIWKSRHGTGYAQEQSYIKSTILIHVMRVCIYSSIFHSLWGAQNEEEQDFRKE